MSQPMLPRPQVDHPEAGDSTSGEGAQTALAAMIRRRRMGENHSEVEPTAANPQQPGPEL